MPETPASSPGAPASQEWTVLFYLCGHFNRTGERDPFVSALEEIREIGATAEMSAAIYLDLESGAQRVALRQGEPVESEMLGAVNSGDPRTLEQFLEWAFDACPARRYVLVMAGLGIMDADSVVGRPPFDSARTFAICDDRATGDAVELHELSATLRKAFPAEGPRRLVMLACDMYAMQFLEVAYELRGVLDFQVGLQPDDRHDTPPLEHWPYPALLRKWQEIAAAPSDRTPRWRVGVDPLGLELAKATVALVSEHYANDPEPVTVSAVNLYALVPLAQALDTFSVVYLQWLSNEVIWRARENVVTRHQQLLERSWSYDLDEVSMAISEALTHAASEALVRWAASAVQSMSYPALSRMLRVLGASARQLAKKGAAQRFMPLADEIAACRSNVERTIAGAAAEQDSQPPLPAAEIDRSVRRLFVPAEDAGAVREPAAWHAIITAARSRFIGAHARELLDALDGIEAATQLSRLARRVSELTRGADEGRPPAIAAVWPPNRSRGLALFRPLDLDKLAESNYLHLRFSRELHWTALLTAIDLIKHHARMLWRLLESQLTAAPLEARYQLMRRLAGSRALTGRHAGQLHALSAPDAQFLTIQPGDASASGGVEPARGGGDSIVSYCVRLSSLERSAAVLERKNNVTRERLERVLTEIGRIGSDVDAPPEATLQQLARCGSLLGDDILYGISERLSEITPTEDRAVHLVIQVPRELMRYPWELLRDRHGWLVERFAIGRQVIADADSAAKWSSTRRHGPMRLLVVAPSITGHGAEIANVGILEGEHIASCFERLQMRLPGLVQPRDYRKYVGRPVMVEQFRALIRERRFDLVHFAGHGRYDPVNPERSCWMFSDGPLYAFELRHTLANAEVTPWLIYGNACEAAAEGGEPRHGYHDGVYGMASAALGQGVPAYIAPLWKISERDAKNLAAAFYEALLLRRTSLGEALALARTSVRDGEEDLDVLITRRQQGPQDGDAARIVRSAGWTGMVLYGDPTPTVMQRLAPAEVRADDDADNAMAAPTDEMSGFIKIIPGL
jgi:hypothetical protein